MQTSCFRPFHSWNSDLCGPRQEVCAGRGLRLEGARSLEHTSLFVSCAVCLCLLAFGACFLHASLSILSVLCSGGSIFADANTLIFRGLILHIKYWHSMAVSVSVLKTHVFSSFNYKLFTFNVLVNLLITSILFCISPQKLSCMIQINFYLVWIQYFHN